MRKHIVIVSEESVLAGHYKCGIGEVVDCMAEELRAYYDVTVITIGTGVSGRIGGRITLGVEGQEFLERAATHVNQICPDLVHNFASPALIDPLQVDCPKVLTFDRWEEDVAHCLDAVAKYDHVTTLSTAYANEMIAAHPEAAQWPLKGILAGISGHYYLPADSIWGGDDSNRAKLYRQLGQEDDGKKIIVGMGRLQPVKGIQDIIDSAQAIHDLGAELVIYGTGLAEYEEQLAALDAAGVLTYYRRMVGYGEMMTALRGADFYLMPSLSEVCGLQPMKAARMGCVPIVRPVGGLWENFDESTAIPITGTLTDAVAAALALSESEYAGMKAACEAGEWTWSTRIHPWIELYGLPTAPPERKITQSISYTPAKPNPPFAKKEDADNE